MFSRLVAALTPSAGKEEGATMVEYGLMLAFIALVCFSAVQSLGLNVAAIYPSVAASL